MKLIAAVTLTVISLTGCTTTSSSILHPESSAPQSDAEQIEQLVLNWAGKFNRGAWTRIYDDWDKDEPMPMYLGEERDRWVIGQDGVASYFNPPAFARSLMDKVVVKPYRLRVKLVANDIAIATWENNLDFKIKKRPGVNDDYRVNAFLRKKDGRWLFIHYAELAMSPLIYVEHLYRKTVTEGFPENALPYDANWETPEGTAPELDD